VQTVLFAHTEGCAGIVVWCTCVYACFVLAATLNQRQGGNDVGWALGADSRADVFTAVAIETVPEAISTCHIFVATHRQELLTCCQLVSGCEVRRCIVGTTPSCCVSYYWQKSGTRHNTAWPCRALGSAPPSHRPSAKCCCGPACSPAVTAWTTGSCTTTPGWLSAAGVMCHGCPTGVLWCCMACGSCAGCGWQCSVLDAEQHDSLSHLPRKTPWRLQPCDGRYWYRACRQEHQVLCCSHPSVSMSSHAACGSWRATGGGLWLLLWALVYELTT